MPGNKNAKFNFNRISISVVPNPQYQQVRISDGDLLSRESSIIISPNQITKLEIFKSYEINTTQLRLHVSDLDNDTASSIIEGKMLIHITIEPMVKKTSGNAQYANFFMCYDMNPSPTVTRVIGTYPTITTAIDLKSITLTRMDVENNFAFTLGGKGPQFDPLGVGETPLNFLLGPFGRSLTETYTPSRVTTDNSNLMLDLDYTDSKLGSDSIITSAPSTGYQMNVETNFEVLGYFFEQYPIFKTPYAWILDDFSTKNDGHLSERASVIKILDLTKYQTWEPYTNVALSNFMMGKVQTNTQNKMESFKSIDFHIVERSTFFNTGRFMFKHNSPKIYAEEMATGNPIDVKAWNDSHNENYVLTNTNGYVKLKKMSNPMYKYYVTFLSSIELQQMQEFHNIFMNLHPEIVTYSFNNVWFGQIDINTVIDLKAETLGDYEVYKRPDGKTYDRIGVGYQVTHTFTQIKPDDATLNLLKEKQEQVEERTYMPVFFLNTEIGMLMLDKGPNSIADFLTQRRDRPSREQTLTLSQLYNNTSDVLCSDDSNPAHSVNIDLDTIPKSGPRSSANTQIAIEAAKLIKRGFSYAQSDCSNFTMKAVRAAGADRGKEPYPDGTKNQTSWFLKYKHNGIVLVESVDKIKPGDIVFFHSQGRDNGHTGIALNNQTFMHSSVTNGRGAATADFKSYERVLGKPTMIFRILPSDPINNKGEA